MEIGVVVDTLSALAVAGVESVLELAGCPVQRVSDPLAWAKQTEPEGVLIAGCASRRDCELFSRMSDAAPELHTVALAASVTLAAPLLRHGASAVLPVASATAWLVVAVEALGSGLSIAPESVLRGWALSGSADRDQSVITDQEVDWLRIIGSGVTISRLADTVGYSERNMKRLLARTYRKLGATTKTQALVEAARLRLLE